MKTVTRLAFLFFVACAAPLMAQRIAPAKIQVALFSKLLAFYTNLGTDEFTIHVVDTPAIAKELEKMVGTKMGNAVLKAVTTGDGPPTDGAKVVYISKMHENIITYTHESKALSITGNPDLVSAGVTLGVGVENNKPKILLNLTSSKSEGIIWNPAILRVAERIE